MSQLDAEFQPLWQAYATQWNYVLQRKQVYCLSGILLIFVRDFTDWRSDGMGERGADVESGYDLY